MDSSSVQRTDEANGLTPLPRRQAGSAGATRAWLTLLLLAAVACGGGAPPPAGAFDERDVRGNYALTYDDVLRLKLSVGGAVREVTRDGYGGIVDFGSVEGQPARLDLTAFCAKAEVRCPSEAFWTKVAIDQPELRKSGAMLQPLQVVNDTVHTLDAGVRAEALGGLVDHVKDDTFLLGLGVSGGASGGCAALALSLAGGRFTREGERFEERTVYRDAAGRACAPSDGGADGGALGHDAGAADTDAGATAQDAGLADGGGAATCRAVLERQRVYDAGAPVDGIAEGKVFLGWAGACAFGPFLAGATLTLETGFNGRRTGPFEPPPFTPAPVVLPDGGEPSAMGDAGS